MRRNGQTLSDDQYASINNLATTIDNNASLIVNINRINNAISIANGKNTAKLQRVTLQDLTDMLSSINADITDLNNISTAYDSINSILSNIANTTSSAITIQPSTNN